MSYFITNSGRMINILEITSDDILLTDIAHHLTKICRYGGALALDKHYSVANHSICLFGYARRNGMNIDIQRGLLLHDASEAYLGDIVSAIKPLLKGYHDLESKLEDIITEKYGLSREKDILSIINELDKRIVLDEALEFMPQHYTKFKTQNPKLNPLGVNIKHEYNLQSTNDIFLDCCRVVNITG